jgi:hypothetical protein
VQRVRKGRRDGPWGLCALRPALRHAEHREVAVPSIRAKDDRCLPRTILPRSHVEYQGKRRAYLRLRRTPHHRAFAGSDAGLHDKLKNGAAIVVKRNASRFPADFFFRLTAAEAQAVVPTPEEKRLLDRALAEFERDGPRGEPWREIFLQYFTR